MIAAENLVKKFGDFTALNGIRCHIPEGCVYGIVGSNGAGKSTFLRLLTGIYRPDGGTIQIDGELVYDNPAVKSRIVFVPDDLYFIGGASMNRMMKLYESVYPHFDRKRFAYLTKIFELNPAASSSSLSKGMRRQAAIILALSCRPKYMFFDETFDGLDPVMRKLVRTLVMQDVLENKATAVVTSHSLRELEDTCDQLAMLHKGGIVLESDVMNLKTSLLKVQVAFGEPFGQDRFAGADILHYEKRGSVATLIVRGEKHAVTEQFAALDPLILDILPLSLEEVFMYELQMRGYHFDANGYDFEAEAVEK